MTVKSAVVSLVGLAIVVLTATASAAEPDPYVASVRQFLEGRFGQKNECMVIGLVDEHGRTTLAAGSLDNGTDRKVDGDSVFLIGSVSKTFTALLLEEMAERGEVKLDDPVSRYLPVTVKVPAHGGREITLLDLATQSSGLPFNASNMTGKGAKEQYETYTVEKMYAFLSSYELKREPGAAFSYSNVGMALLGQALAVKAGTSFESLVVDRICQPLQMPSTRLTMTAEMRARLAMGHDKAGQPSPPWQMQAYGPAGSVLSTGNDLLTYVAAQAGITSCALSPLMEKTHAIRHLDSTGPADAPDFGPFGRTAMPWTDRNVLQPTGMQLLGHAGGAGSYHAFVGFDMKQHRGVIVLTTANELSAEAVGWTVLQRRPLNHESATQFAREQVGVGVALELAPQTKALRITKVFPNSPAAQAGLTAGMTIKRVGDVAMEGKSLAESMRLIRGEAGTTVRLEVVDAGGKGSTIEVTRQVFLIAPPT